MAIESLLYEQRGQVLSNNVRRIDKHHYKVKSQLNAVLSMMDLFIRSPLTKNINYIRLHGDHNNNNKMKRLNDEVRNRKKVMRGLKKADTRMLIGYQIFHNYIREYKKLNGKTPTEVSGIKIKGDNRLRKN